MTSSKQWSAIAPVWYSAKIQGNNCRYVKRYFIFIYMYVYEFCSVRLRAGKAKFEYYN